MAYKMTVVNPAPKGGRKMAKKKTGGRKKASKKKTKRKLSAKQKAALAKGRKKAAAMRKKKTTKRKTKKKVAKRKVKRKTKKKVAKKKVAKKKTAKRKVKRKTKKKTAKRKTKKKATKKKTAKRKTKKKTAKRKVKRKTKKKAVKRKTKKKAAKRKTKKVAKRKVVKVAKPRRRRPPMPAGVPKIKLTPSEAEERLSGAGRKVSKSRSVGKRKRKAMRSLPGSARRMQLASHGYLQLNPEGDNPVEQVPGHRGLFVVTPPKKGKVRSKAVVMRTGKGRDPTKAGRGAVGPRRVSKKREVEIKKIKSQMGRL